MADAPHRGSGSLRFYAAVGFGVAALAVIVLATQSRQETKVEPTVTRVDGSAPWCANGLEAIAGGACFAAPGQKKQFPLIIYLHGLHTPATIGEEQERQARVAKKATEKGYGVLALHGEKGACSRPELVDTFCWPSNERMAERAPKVVESWQPILEYAKLRGATAQKYLFGFSNGGYFTFLLIMRKLITVDAAVIAHAGAVGQVNVSTWLGPVPPMLLETADDDPSNNEMIALGGQLTQNRWPHIIGTRDGGHMINDWNVEMALQFFTRVASGEWPLNPPLAMRAPRPSRPADEAGAADASALDADVRDHEGEHDD